MRKNYYEVHILSDFRSNEGYDRLRSDYISLLRSNFGSTGSFRSYTGIVSDPIPNSSGQYASRVGYTANYLGRDWKVFCAATIYQPDSSPLTYDHVLVPLV